MDDVRIEQLGYHLDAVAGTQAALTVAISLLMAAHKSNPQAIAAMGVALEQTRAGLLASSASDYKIEAFDTIAESLIARLS